MYRYVFYREKNRRNSLLMQQVFTSLFFAIVLLGEKPYSDNKEVNRYIKEVYVKNVLENFDSKKNDNLFWLKV